jgi:hypothetical protein
MTKYATSKAPNARLSHVIKSNGLKTWCGKVVNENMDILSEESIFPTCSSCTRLLKYKRSTADPSIWKALGIDD